jgi:hypothetical protein
LVGLAAFPMTMPLLLSLGKGLTSGRDVGSPASERYQPPFAFGGTIKGLTLDVAGNLIEI